MLFWKKNLNHHYFFQFLSFFISTPCMTQESSSIWQKHKWTQQEGRLTIFFFFDAVKHLKGENCHALIYITFIYIFAFIHLSFCLPHFLSTWCCENCESGCTHNFVIYYFLPGKLEIKWNLDLEDKHQRPILYL